MTRNTKEIALIQIRSGDLSQLPKALHQSEFGLAIDENRLFIGNSANTKLKNRVNEFPYQNLEILTEYSDLKDHFAYSYENNVKSVIKDGVVNDNRNTLRELTPLVISCTVSNPTISSASSVSINGTEVLFAGGETIGEIIDKINAQSDTTHVYASQLEQTDVITFICFQQQMVINNTSGNVIQDIGLPTHASPDHLPERKITDKLDDFLNITDFGIVGDGQKNVSKELFDSLLQVYTKNTDKQFARNVYFPAGEYICQPVGKIEYPFPIISNMNIKGAGVDRTVIKGKSFEKLSSFMSCFDDKMTSCTNPSYGVQGKTPRNVVIEDMTFNTSLTTLCTLKGCEDITFNRVKFIGDNSQTFVMLEGLSQEQFAKNITFNECIFETGLTAIDMNKFVKNVNITKCLFKDLAGNAILIGKDDITDTEMVSAINLSSNIFNDCVNVATTTDYVIKLGQNAKYVSIQQSQFDVAVSAQTGTILPYKDFEGENRTNYIDTLDPRTDNKKILRFNYAQPKWEFLNYLTNKLGEIVLTVDGEDGDITAKNGLNIKSTDTAVIIDSVKEGDVILQQNENSNLELGKSENGESFGQVIIHKDLNVNDKEITNKDGQNDIIFETAPNKVLAIKQDDGSTIPYEQRIQGIPNAIPNVAFIRKVGNQYINSVITSESIKDNKGSIPIITFSKDRYGNRVYLTDLSVNVRVPFKPIHSYKNSAVRYANEHKYYKGDVVKNMGTTPEDTVYGVVLTDHVASGSFEDAVRFSKVKVISKNQMDDIKYIDIMAILPDNRQIFLTRDYNPAWYAPTRQNTFRPTVDISAVNTYQWNPKELDPQKEYGTGEEVVRQQGSTYAIIETGIAKTYTPEDLHNPELAFRKYEEGFEYHYNMDRTLVDSNGNVFDKPLLNLSGATLVLNFVDKQGNIIPTIADKTQLSPTGLMVVRANYCTETTNDYSDDTAIIKDVDYLVMKYIWTSGQDLDTKTTIINTPNASDLYNKPLGWSFSSQVPSTSSVETSVLAWCSDNRESASPEKAQEEDVLLSCTNLEKRPDFETLPNVINVELGADWYSQVGSTPTYVMIKGYRGGTMEKINYQFINRGGEEITFTDENGDIVSSIKLELKNMPTTLKTYNKVGVLHYDKTSRTVRIEITPKQ